MKTTLFSFSMLLFGLLTVKTYGQSTSNSATDSKQITVLTADSLASGGLKDVTTSFFQLAFNDLTGPQKAVSFSASPFAVMARANPKLLTDTSYYRYRHLSDLNINFSVQLDSANSPSNISLGLKYSIINKRNITVSKDFIVKSVNKNKDFDKLRDGITAKLSIKKREFSERQLLSTLDLVNKWENDSNMTYAKFDDTTKMIIQKVIQDSNLVSIGRMIKLNSKLSFRTEVSKNYNDLKNEFEQKPIWTIGAGTSMKTNTATPLGQNNPNFQNLAITSEFLCGLNSTKNSVNLQLDIIAVDSITTDNTMAVPNLSRNVMSFEPGVNFVIRSAKKNGNSLFEFKVSGTYYHTASKPYPNQSADSSTINATMRLRLFNDFWLPVTFKMNNAGKVYGSLGMKINFTSLAAILRKSS